MRIKKKWRNPLYKMILWLCNIQVSLCQKLLFLHQLTYNMTTDCSFMTSSVHENYKLRTCSEHVVYINCFECQNKNKKQYMHMYWTGKSMNNLLSYCRLVDAKRRASDKDLLVSFIESSSSVSLNFVTFAWLGTLSWAIFFGWGLGISWGTLFSCNLFLFLFFRLRFLFFFSASSDWTLISFMAPQTVSFQIFRSLSFMSFFLSKIVLENFFVKSQHSVLKLCHLTFFSDKKIEK